MSRWWRLRCWRDLLYRYDFDACIIFNFELVSSLPPLLCKWQTSITSLLPLQEWSLRLNLWERLLCWRAYPSLAVFRILQRYTISLPLDVHHLIRASTYFQLTDIPLHALSKYINVTLIKFDFASRHLPLVDSIQILSDQRYSFLLTANQPISNYWPGFHADWS